MPLFGFRKAMAESRHALDADLDRVMQLPPIGELAAELMLAFGPAGPKRSKPLTEHDLIGWMLDKYEFGSRARRLLGYQKLSGPLREALQVLEHAELVYVTVDSERSDEWRATSAGSRALTRGKDEVRQHISERTRAPSAPSTADRLHTLEDLRSTGVISEDEYSAKRRQIIEEI